MSTVYFDSRKNYLKRAPSSGPRNMPGPSVSAYGGYIYTSVLPIAHGVTGVPMFRVYYEPFGDGIIYPAVTLPLSQSANNIMGTGTPTGPGLIAWADKTNLNVTLFYSDATLASKTFPVYCVIYEDVQL